MTLQQIGERYGITKQAVSNRLASLKIIRPARLPKCSRIDKARLETLYTVNKLSVNKISDVLGTNARMIYLALEFYDIPRRTSIVRSRGKHLDLLKELNVQEKIEIKSKVKYPYITLHSSARIAGIKIRVENVGEGIFSVIRTA